MGFDATVSTYEHGFKIWEIKKDDKDWRTVCFGRAAENEGPTHTCFYIDHEIKGHAVIINNDGWDLICFDLEYPPKEILRACELHLDWIKKEKKLLKVEAQHFSNYDHLMEHVS